MINKVMGVNRNERPTTCKLAWGNIILEFAIVEKRMSIISRDKVGASRMQSCSDLNVPDRIFREMTKRAYGILGRSH